jgi:hypothetical protein
MAHVAGIKKRHARLKARYHLTEVLAKRFLGTLEA